jgi:hypothetical protein
MLDIKSLGLSKVKDHGYYFSALCPFHSERNPSFMINKEKGFFKCFSCGKKGSYDYLRKFLLGEDNLEINKEELGWKTYVKDPFEFKKPIPEYDIIGKLYDPFSCPETIDYLTKRNCTFDFCRTFDFKYAREPVYIENLSYKKEGKEKYAVSFSNRIFIPLVLL